MAYLLAIRRRTIEENRELGTHKKWLKQPGIFIGYAREIVDGRYIDKLLAKVTLCQRKHISFMNLQMTIVLNTQQDKDRNKHDI